MSFIVIDTKTRVSLSAGAIEYEKHCLTRNAALSFCLQLTDLGGELVELVQLIQAREDAVPDGQELARSVGRQRTRLASDTMPVWR